MIVEADAPEFFITDWSDLRVENDIMRIALCATQRGETVVRVRLAVPLQRAIRNQHGGGLGAGGGAQAPPGELSGSFGGLAGLPRLQEGEPGAVHVRLGDGLHRHCADRLDDVGVGVMLAGFDALVGPGGVFAREAQPFAAFA